MSTDWAPILPPRRQQVQEPELVSELRRLPLRPSSVTRVIAVLDDPSKGAADVARAVAPDASLCARILHLANSPYFGSSGRVSSLDRAVVTVGASVVRSLAVSTAAGLLGEGSRVPEDFWAHSGAVGVGAAVVARRLGAPHADALCAGLLHDLGAALAYRHDRDAYAEVVDGRPEDLLAREQARYGANHAALGAIALRAWRLPDSVVDAVANHHAPQLDIAPTLLHAVIGGEALVRLALGDGTGVGAEPVDDPAARLAALGYREPDVAAGQEQLREEAQALGAVLVAA
jgi:putative nucleotidyltransferase with HDIG domain